MPKAVNRPSEEQVREFDEHIKHWQQVLNLMDWRLERSNKPIRAAMAAMQCDSQARLGIYQLGDFGSTDIDTESLSMTALHECLHVFLFDLIATAQDRLATPEQLDAAEHRVINVLERVLYAQANDS